MANHFAEADLVAVLSISTLEGGTWHTTASLVAVGTATGDIGGAPYSGTSFIAVASISAEADVFKALGGTSTASVVLKARGYLNRVTEFVQFYSAPTGAVNNIEDLPTDPVPADGTVYTVLGTASNREPCTAIYSTILGRWTYQPFVSGANSEVNIINPMVGKYITMPNYVNLNGVPHVPKYWSTNTVNMSTFNYSVITLPVIPEDDNGALPKPPAFGGSVVQWRWMVEDLADPGTDKYALSSWPAHGGVGPTWQSSGFYRPQVKGTVKFNNKKNKTRAQRSVVFNHKQVDHMWMEYPSGIPQPFSVVMVGIIHSYPTAKFGHYMLDAGRTTPVFDADKTGKDFFFDEGATPRNVMLYMKKTARMGTNTQPDIKDGLNIRIKHTEKARPRMFYGVFNGANSMFGARDKKAKFRGTGPIDGGTHRYFVIGRRTNRVSDNRAAVMSLWEIIIIHKALSVQEIDGLYEEMASKYQFKEYS